MAGSGADAPTSAPAQAAPLPERLVSLAREALGELDALGDALGDGQGVSIGMQGVRRQGSASGFVLGTERQQQLRDLLFKKDTMEALTASEFAMALDTSVLGNKEGAGSAEAGGGEAELRAMTRIDYDRLLRRLSSAVPRSRLPDHRWRCPQDGPRPRPAPSTTPMPTSRPRRRLKEDSAPR